MQAALGQRELEQQSMVTQQEITAGRPGHVHTLAVDH